MPDLNLTPKQRNLLVLVLLAALAAFLYISVVVKIAQHGF
jgi:hypothetical protein